MKKLAPYQIFFPIGTFNAIVAVGVWYVQNLGWLNTPVLWVHSRLIAGGFLWSFIVGFLMTALPKMTGTKSANRFECTCAFILILALMMFSWWMDGRFFYATHIFLITFLLIFAGRRLFKMTKTIPVFFSHIGLAMLLALFGSYHYLQNHSFVGFHLYQVGAVLLLVLGIGTRFFSFLSGLPSVFEMEASVKTPWLFHLAGVLVSILLYLAGIGYAVSYLGLSILLLAYLFMIWKVQRPSIRSSALRIGVRIVAATLPITFFMIWLQPTLYLAWFHMLFIVGFGMITFSVATRVTLAHGSYPIDLEVNSKALWYLISFLVVAMLSRVLYGYTSGLWRVSCLHTAAMFWIGAVYIWSHSFMFKIFKPGPQGQASC